MPLELAEDRIVKIRELAEPIDPYVIMGTLADALEHVSREARQLTSTAKSQLMRINAFLEFAMSQLSFSGVVYLLKYVFQRLEESEQYRVLYPLVASAASRFLRFYSRKGLERIKDLCGEYLPERFSAIIWGADTVLLNCLSAVKKIEKLNIVDSPPYWLGVRLAEQLRGYKIRVGHMTFYPYYALEQALSGIDLFIVSLHSVVGSVKGPQGLAPVGGLGLSLMAKNNGVPSIGVTLAGLVFVEQYLTYKDIPRRQTGVKRLKTTYEEPIYEFIPLNYIKELVTDFGRVETAENAVWRLEHRFTTWALNWIRDLVKSEYKV